MQSSVILMLCAKASSGLRDISLLLVLGRGTELDSYFYLLLWAMLPVVWFRDSLLIYFGRNLSKTLSLEKKAKWSEHVPLIIVNAGVALFAIMILYGGAIFGEYIGIEKSEILSRQLTLACAFVVNGIASLYVNALLIAMEDKRHQLIIELASSFLMMLLLMGFAFLAYKPRWIEIFEVFVVIQFLSLFLTIKYLSQHNQFNVEFRGLSWALVWKDTLGHVVGLCKMISPAIGAVLLTLCLIIEQQVFLRLGEGWLGVISIAAKFSGIIVAYGVSILSREAIYASAEYKFKNPNYEQRFLVYQKMMTLIWSKFGKFFIPLLVIASIFSIPMLPFLGGWVVSDVFIAATVLLLPASCSVVYQVTSPMFASIGKSYLIIVIGLIYFVYGFIYVYVSPQSLTYHDFALYYVLQCTLFWVAWSLLVAMAFRVHFYQRVFISTGRFFLRNIGKIRPYKTVGIHDILFVDGIKYVVKKNIHHKFWSRTLARKNDVYIYKLASAEINIDVVEHSEKLSSPAAVFFKFWPGRNLSDIASSDLALSEKCRIFEEFGSSLRLLHNKLAMISEVRDDASERSKVIAGDLGRIKYNVPELLLLFRILIVHGDLVPANVMCNFDGDGAKKFRFALVDFDSREYFSDDMEGGNLLLFDLSSFVGSIFLMRHGSVDEDNFVRNTKLACHFSVGYFGVDMPRSFVISSAIGRLFLKRYFRSRDPLLFLLSPLLLTFLVPFEWERVDA